MESQEVDGIAYLDMVEAQEVKMEQSTALQEVQPGIIIYQILNLLL